MTQRRTDVDPVRFLALVSMYVAHVAPVSGPARVLELSEYLTMPLFALLVGVGAQLGSWSAASTWQRCWSTGVRALVLIVLGLALEQAGAQVVIVLVHLGALVVVAALLAVLPTVVLVGVGAVVPLSVSLLPSPDPTTALAGSEMATRAELFLWAGGPYRLVDMVAYAAVGIVLARWWLRRDPSDRTNRTNRTGRTGPTWAPGVVGGGLLVAAAVMLGVEQTGRLDLVPYSGTVQEILLNCLLASGVFGVGLAAERALRTRLPGRVLVPVLARAGAMTLTLYAMQVLWLAYDTRVLHPGEADDTWTNLAVLLVGSVGVAWVWWTVVRRDPWRRGPIEGPTHVLTRVMR